MGAWAAIPSAQIGTFASILLISTISVTLALRTPGGPAGAPAAITAEPRATPLAKPEAAQGSATPTCGIDCARDRPNLTASAAPTIPAPSAVTAPAPAPPAYAPAADRDAAALPPPAMMAPAAPAPATPPPPVAPLAPAALAAAEPVPGPAARTVKESSSRFAMADRDYDGGANDIVVTGSRVTRMRRATRGDWNACTVDDPAKTLRKCKHWIGRDGTGAATQISAGLTMAWRGDWVGATEAFTQAIAIKPHTGFAYLNRGLAYQRIGDLERAAADLDLAVKYDGDARSYYNRAAIRRERGAQADAAQAVALDPRYSAVVG